MISREEIMKRVIKYIIQGLMVAIACYAIPKQTLRLEEIGLIALIASLTFSILDTYIPTMNKYM
jgi:hypothetical protein